VDRGLIVARQPNIFPLREDGGLKQRSNNKNNNAGGASEAIEGTSKFLQRSPCLPS
jgi:hypothetical protein